MNPKLRETWVSVQRAETLLFQAAVLPNIQHYRRLMEGMDIEGDSLNLLLRIINGFDPENLSPQDYLTRYPFSSVDAIKASLECLVESGYLVGNGTENYSATKFAKKSVHRWQQGVAKLMQAVGIGNIPSEDVQQLIKSDVHILESLKNAWHPHGSPILGHRLRGLHPSYKPPELWHHWMHVWTMLAASEDEEEYVRQQLGMDPLIWFVRRQIWFAHRRPWRARALTMEALTRRASGYSPLQDAHLAISQAIRGLKTRDWLKEENNGEFRLTDDGLAACDEDEYRIDAGFLSGWPVFSEAEFDRLLDITMRLNAQFLEVIQQNEKGS